MRQKKSLTNSVRFCQLNPKNSMFGIILTSSTINLISIAFFALPLSAW